MTASGKRIIVLADDYVFSAGSTYGLAFSLNCMDWLTGLSSGKAVLVDKHFDDTWGNYVRSYLTSHGYTVTISYPSSGLWDASYLSGYDAIFWWGQGSGVGSPVLSYLNSGGNVLWMGGTGSLSLTESNTLLNAIGVTASATYALSGTYAVSSSHPCVTGISSLLVGGPSEITTDGLFSGDAVAIFSGHNIVLASTATTESIISITPNFGPVGGGTFVTITGTGFTGATDVTFNGNSCTSFHWINDSTITCYTPAGLKGVWNVVVVK